MVSMNKKQLRISLVVMGMFAIIVMCMGLVGGISKNDSNLDDTENSTVSIESNVESNNSTYKNDNETIELEEKK